MKTKKKTALRVLAVFLAVVFFMAAGVVGWYWYDANVDRSGWVQQDGQYYYRDFHNHNVTGWQEIRGSRYYFNESGILQTGWFTDGGKKYYLDSDGAMATGWITLEDQKYFLNEDGTLHTGLLNTDGHIYLMDAEGRPLTGPQQLGEDLYYFNEDGTAVTGPLVLEDKSYFYGDNGVRRTGWINLPDGPHYYQPDGSMAHGFQEIDGNFYYLEEDTGLPRQGWYTRGEYSYYLGGDGAALMGPQIIDGRQHYFTPNGIHVILVNATNPIPDYYDPDLVTLVDWHRIARIALKPMQNMLRDCRDAGNEVAINSIYRSGENQKKIIEERTEEHMKQGLTYDEAYLKTLETVALPGTSEHETGLSADLVGESAKKWLSEHCWEYGFILRYPPEKGDITGITYEPWHFRYVGREVSMDMKDTGLCLEEYLGAGPAK